MRQLLLILTLLLATAGNAGAATLRVAVASNFSQTAKQLVERFQNESGHRVLLSPGATGKHYAQIRNGAPFDAFLAADSDRPRLLEQQGLALPGSRFTYAQGRLLLWSPDSELIDPEGKVLQNGTFRHLAIGNPRLAPYGRAGWQTLERLELAKALAGRLVRGENIGQTFQFVASGNAELGLIALSQVRRPGEEIPGSFWLVPEHLYDPIEQQAVLLRESEAARDFFAFLRSEQAKRLLQAFGYNGRDAY
ncbi:MAG: molybdate ABC transporter substrate-binding protein [Gammaproteobacteria bacterium]|nr:molybdate ABC transporter substrate-binding protein [Gammaproteobacteria bacterium]